MAKKKNDENKYQKSYAELLKESIVKDLKQVEKHSKSFNWLLEFSKKVVFGAFLVFLISTAVEIYVIYKSSLLGEPISLDTFISETNNTFRIVVGSYCIKACMENLSKISFSKYGDILKIKDKLLKEELTQDTGIQFDDANNTVNEDPVEYSADDEVFESSMNDEVMS